MTKDQLNKRIFKVEQILKKGTRFPVTTKMLLDNLKYRRDHPIMYRIKHKIRKLVLSVYGQYDETE